MLRNYCISLSSPLRASRRSARQPTLPIDPRSCVRSESGRDIRDSLRPRASGSGSRGRHGGLGGTLLYVERSR